MTTKFKVGQWISKEDVLKLGEVRWSKFREKYRSEHCTTKEFTACGLFEDHDYWQRQSARVKVYNYGDLVWEGNEGKHEDQISYETILEYIGEKEMKEFDLKTMPWWIKVENEEESKAVQNWLFEQGITWRTGDTIIRTSTVYNYFMNIGGVGVLVKDGFMHSSRLVDGMLQEYEIKLSFALKVDKVEFPSVKSEQEIQLEKLKEQIEELSKQASVLEKAIKGEV